MKSATERLSVVPTATNRVRQVWMLVVMTVGMLGLGVPATLAQPEVTAWGNLQGIRVEGQLMAFETSLCVVGSDWSDITRTAKEQQPTRYAREGNRQISSTNLDSLFFTEVVEDAGPGLATVEVQVTARADTSIAGAFLCLELPAEDYADGTVDLIDPAQPQATPSDGPQTSLRARAGGVRFSAPRRQLQVTFGEPAEVIVERDTSRGGAMQAYLPIVTGAVEDGQTAQATFTFEATGEVDRAPITLTLDPSQPGRPFDGLGGNFRIQNPEVDPPVIEYLLDSLRVAWGRVDVPWWLWHPEEDMDPIAAAEAGDLHPRVERAMEMAQTLHRRGIPVILAIWSGPDWAIIGSRREPPPEGLRGHALDSEKTDQIYASITDYIVYLEEHYGVPVEMFSFNESDLGIDIRQTAEEHAELIKGLGAYFASRGLETKLLLGDTADANGYDFLEPAMADAATHPYLGAVSFHSWRGWDTETLEKWDAAAERMNLPLIVGEGSIDAAAWRYPAIFEEPTYAMEEINLYTRILAICEPMSILQWQLTADYSVMAGGGVFGNDEEPLHPTQRFWNLKQLSATPQGLFAMPLESDRPDVTSAALGDTDRGTYAVHLVNDGATREATLTGLPDDVNALRIYVTDSERGMEEGEPIPVVDGQAEFTLDAVSYTTLISE